MSEVLSGILPRGQRLRTGSILMAGGTALLACLALLVCAFLDLLPWDVAIAGTAGVVTLVAVFALMFRTGVNRRFRDPSLATEQAAAAILFLAYIMYHAGPAREALTLFYPLVMLFGALRLTAARLAALSVLALAAHGAMLHFTWLREQEFMDVDAAVTEFAVLMVALPWFAAMGGYVNRLRARLTASSGGHARGRAHPCRRGGPIRRHGDDRRCGICPRRRRRNARQGRPGALPRQGGGAQPGRIIARR